MTVTWWNTGGFAVWANPLTASQLELLSDGISPLHVDHDHLLYFVPNESGDPETEAKLISEGRHPMQKIARNDAGTAKRD